VLELETASDVDAVDDVVLLGAPPAPAFEPSAQAPLSAAIEHKMSAVDESNRPHKRDRTTNEQPVTLECPSRWSESVEVVDAETPEQNCT
jgi:hypothetical protein